MAIKLTLKYGGGEVDFLELLKFFRQNNNIVIVGDQNDVLEKHRKPYSLDYWLRTHGANQPNTKQATTEWLQENLYTTGFFAEDHTNDPETGRDVKAVRLLTVD